jgi:hypothetical protein
MSLITFTEDCSAENHRIFSLAFLAPVIIRASLNFLFPFKADLRKCYVRLSFLTMTSFIFSYWPSYYTYLVFIINISVYLLTIVATMNLRIPDYFELYNTLSFIGLLITPAFFWIGIAGTWGFIAYNNLKQASLSSVFGVLIQAFSAYNAFLFGNDCDVTSFYVFLSTWLLLILLDLDVLNRNK